jgi:hypothetical protein
MRMKNAKGEQGRIPDGLESMVDRVASIEKTLGIYELAQFTSRI